MRGSPVLLLVLALLLAGPGPTGSGLAEGGTRGAVQTRSVEALLGAPPPVDDAHAWRVDVPDGASVTVLAEGTLTSMFLFTHHRADEPAPPVDRAGNRASVTLPGPGAWRVALDPLGGGPVRVDLLFTGRYGDPESGAPAEFTLLDLQRGEPCLAQPPGGCLP